MGSPPRSLVGGEDAAEVELGDADHGAGAVLVRDDHDTDELAVGEPVEIRLTDRTVEILLPE